LSIFKELFENNSGTNQYETENNVIRKLSIKAPAKINLHLEVLGKRPDGFHSLRSIFIMVNLFDSLVLEKKSSPGCGIEGFDGIAVQQNLIWRAYQEVSTEVSLPFGVEVCCEKRIPSMAGLGGGSSDAAAMLRGLETLMRDEEMDFDNTNFLKRIGERLGSDVPFFLGAPAAYVEGRGEILRKLEKIRNETILLIKPEIDISTREAFSLLDAGTSKGEKTLSGKEIIHAYNSLSPGNWPFFNSFTPLLIDRHKRIGELLEELRKTGADYVNVSGSGSAVYGVYEGEEKAKNAQITLKDKAKNVWKLKMLASGPEAVYNEIRLE